MRASSSSGSRRTRPPPRPSPRKKQLRRNLTQLSPRRGQRKAVTDSSCLYDCSCTTHWFLCALLNRKRSIIKQTLNEAKRAFECNLSRSAALQPHSE
uniref:Uncharacterized protein n=1 Tax=Zea mays TaxID=4577 RepID=A0A804M3E5_MAIZE